ncbi:MAG TPA: GntR family transcriptional regulator [Spirochaetales bacterium]|nr:GntR family transcriptional regulator [Spirochaetales bacterium]HOV37643.1 GntR family transcriptional regulator [Spirochaetales bacterium]
MRIKTGGSDTEKNKKLLAYEILKNRIISNELKPLEYLNEKVLCEELGVSKTPIREALQHLEQNRFVVIIPNKGCFVSNIGLDLIREVFEMREIHECAAARIAATRPNREFFKELLEQEDSFEPKSLENAKQKLLSGYQIHKKIIDFIGNSLLSDFYQIVLDHIVRIRIYFFNKFDNRRLQETADEHQKILEAILAGDPEKAEVAMQEHLENALTAIKQMI